MPDDAPVIAPVVTSVVEPAWHAGADAETLGHLQTRGWADKPANEVALAAVKAHREAEKHIGVPVDQILRLPKEASDEAGWNNVWQRLGAPDKPEGYDFTGVKFADGTELDESFVGLMRETAAKLHLPKDAATEITRAFTNFLEKSEQSDLAETTAKLAEAKTALQTNWGKNFDANLFVAKNTAAKLGVTPEQVAALEGAVGYDKVMEMFRSIGEKTGEATFVNSLAPNANGVMTKEQAVSRKSELMADHAWVKGYLDGDNAKGREMTALNTIITS